MADDVGFDSFVIEVQGAGLDASTVVLSVNVSSLGDFFSELARDWRGWEAPRRWDSLEGELTIEAHQDGTGHDWLQFTVRHNTPPDWTLTLVVSVEAGEQMANLAGDVRDFVLGQGA